MVVTPHHKSLVRETLRQQGPLQPRKRRRANPEVVTVKLESSDSSDMELEDVELARPEPRSETPDAAGSAAESSADAPADSDDFDDLEDVDLDAVFAEPSNEVLSFAIAPKEDAPKAKRKFTPIARDERRRRRLVHKLYLATMMCHGATRNRWCNDEVVRAALRSTVAPETYRLFHQQGRDVMDLVKARRFVDGINTLLKAFAKRFKVTRQGILRRDWAALHEPPSNAERVTLARFRRLARSFTGSRDVGAQLFVALLRSVGVNARLVFSLQPPDYRSLTPASAEPESEKSALPTPQLEFDPVFIPHNPRQALLAGIRSKSHGGPAAQPAQPQVAKYPVFWIEVWNMYSRKWLTVDPMVFQVCEIVPKRKRTKFEPPASEESNQTWYVLAYDRRGVVKDVTRRYTQYYNARTSKKRIGFNSDEDQHWYLRVVRAVGKEAPTSQAEATELKEFHDRDICEGLPNSMTDFKNHPIYALESQLRQDEVIYPKDDSSKCGTFRLKTKDRIMPVYKRSHVYRLRPARSWYMRGRVLKVGVQPLKTKAGTAAMLGEDSADDDGTIRLYAEFQTSLYIPPPIENGQIAKNAYGNVEIFTPSMMPENGYLVKLDDVTTMKMLERAARDFLRIDYARAIVSFDFKNKLKNSLPTAKEGGILIEAQYKEAMLAILDGMREQEEERRRAEVELNALKSWKFFLKKLQIMHSLNVRHGKVEETEPQAEEEDDGYFSVASEGAGSDNDVENYVPRKRAAVEPEDEDEFEEGGFLLGNEATIVNDATAEQTEDGGFFAEGGGFLPTEEDGNRLDGIESVENSDGGGFFAQDSSGFPSELHTDAIDVTSDVDITTATGALTNEAPLQRAVEHGSQSPSRKDHTKDKRDAVHALTAPDVVTGSVDAQALVSSVPTEFPSARALRAVLRQTEQTGADYEREHGEEMISAESDDAPETLQQDDAELRELDEEEAELGFEYSDSE